MHKNKGFINLRYGYLGKCSTMEESLFNFASLCCASGLKTSAEILLGLVIDIWSLILLFLNQDQPKSLPTSHCSIISAPSDAQYLK